MKAKAPVVQTLMPVYRPGMKGTLFKKKYDDDHIAEEVAVAFEYNGISQAVMLATPADLEDLAYGFSLTEGFIDTADDIYGIEETCQGNDHCLHIEISSLAFTRLKAYRRHLAGRTGCGLCGVESLDMVRRPLSPLPTINVEQRMPLKALYSALEQLPAQQTLQQSTGAVHAACLIEANGTIQYLREDIGRHNALDKTLGALARASLSGGIQKNAPYATLQALLVTSRASFEMVQKTAILGFRMLAAVSAPTAAAIRLAKSLNICLVGFLRQRHCVVYSCADYLQEPDELL